MRWFLSATHLPHTELRFGESTYAALERQRSYMSKVEVAVAYKRPSASVRRPSANAARRHIESTQASAVNRHVLLVIAL